VGRTQTSFLAEFKSSFQRRTGIEAAWVGSQALSNTSALPFNQALRRPGPLKNGERFELGDIAANIGKHRVVIEFESAAVPLSNILKYWPYVRGELASRPSSPIVLCHFSNWWSYATRRDLWEWTLARMKADPDRMVEVEGRQFDHWSDDQQRRSQSVEAAIDWIVGITGISVSPKPMKSKRHR